MGSMIIFHANHRQLNDEQTINVMLPSRMTADERQTFFRKLLRDGVYQPAYHIDNDRLDVAFDCGNGYAPTGVNVTVLPNTAHTSTSVGDIIIVNGLQRMLVMPMGFEEIF